jgi:hypothetical protein
MIATLSKGALLGQCAQHSSMSSGAQPFGGAAQQEKLEMRVEEEKGC